MKPILTFLVLAAFLLPTTPAAKPGCGIVPTGCEAWTARYDEGTQNIAPIITAAEDRVFIASIQDAPQGRQTAVHALDSATGARLWHVTFQSEGGPEPHGIVASPDGARVHVIGTSYVGPHGRIAQMFLATFNGHTGDLLWDLNWASPSEGEDIWTDGATLYAVGATNNNYATVAYDAATGAQQWASSYDAHGGFNLGWRGWSYDVAFDVIRAGSNLYVTGVSAAPDGLLEYATVALDASTGAQQWAARSHGTDEAGNPVPSEAYATEAHGGLVYVFGNDGLHALDAQTGGVTWTQSAVRCRPYWPMHHEECELAVTPDGAHAVVFTHNDLATYDARTGDVTWHHVLRLGNDRYGLARAMVLSPDGSRVYIATPGGMDDYVTDTLSSAELVYETRAFEVADGALAWRVTYGRHCCSVEGIAVSPDGDRVFVTGETGPPGSAIYTPLGPPEILTVAYDTNLGLETVPL